ncbi:hypothetical protein SD81_039810 [Tolypothrix campylonemoides VB511288]|nr:hypothetical protein SD81_039810 [Tolypothrix campylonemoides VB511288]
MNKPSKINTNTEHFSKNIATQWYEERSRQASASFNLAIGLATATVIFGIATAVSVCMNNVSVAAATTAVGLTSGVASKRLFKLYDDTNTKLDDVAKELLDE